MAKLYWFLVESDGAVLLAQRKDDQPPFAGRWVLPGDVAERGEDAGDVARRIGRSELDVNVMGTSPYDTLSVDDNGTSQEVEVYRIGFEGQPRHRESGAYAEVGWASSEDLDDLDIELPEQLTELLKKLGG